MPDSNNNEATVNALDPEICDVLYQALETEHTVRFLRACRRDTDGAIAIELRHFGLLERSCPSFYAVSYVWGEREFHAEPIIVDGRACKVLKSLYPILGLMCDHPDLKHQEWFWIDYLCINQGDGKGDRLERAHQVTLMGDLFRSADQTIVWLGNGGPETSGAAEALDYLSSWPWPPGITEDQISRLRNSVTESQWRAMSHWMLRPWWTRVWTLQEFLLPESLTFYLGNESITKESWDHAISNIYTYNAIECLGKEAFGNQWARRRLMQHYECESTHHKMGLVAMMAYVGYYKATDDRDRIYALLGVCKDLDRKVVGTPDYNSSVGEVYTRLVESFIQLHRSLDIICFAPLFNGPRSPSDTEPTLPSWVPDWRCWSDRVSRPVPSMVSEPGRYHIGSFPPPPFMSNDNVTYSASGGQIPQFLISPDRLRLICKGIAIGAVDGLVPVHQPGPVEGTEAHQQLVQSTSDINTKHPKKVSSSSGVPKQPSSDCFLEAVIRCLTVDRAGRYLTSHARLSSYIDEFQNAVSDSSEGLKPLQQRQERVVNWFLAGQALLVRGATLKTHHLAATTVQKTFRDPGKHTLWRASETTVGERPWDCRLVVTDDGFVAMAPRESRKGDVIYVLIGCSVPVVLRRVDSSTHAPFVVVGECFLPDFMNGRAFSIEEIQDLVLV